MINYIVLKSCDNVDVFVDREVIIDKIPSAGLLMLSVDLPYGCFIEGATMDTDDLYIYDPTAEPRFQKTIEC